MSSPVTSPSDAPRRKRRWWRFSLRTLLICVTLFCLLAGWFATLIHRAERQRIAIAKLKAAHIDVTYDWAANPDGSYNLDGEAPGPQWLRDWLGNDFLDTVVAVSSPMGQPEQRRLTDNKFEPIFSLPRLRSLSLWKSGISSASIARLPELKELENLSILDDRINDSWLESISRCSVLKKLMLNESPLATPNGLARLGSLINLEELQLNRSNADDSVVHALRNLRRLRKLTLGTSKVTDAGMEGVGRFSRLEFLWLEGAPISDRGMEQLASLPELRELYLGWTAIGDAGLQQIADHKHINRLIIADTKITDSGLKNLAGWTALEHLTISNTAVGDSGLKFVSGFKNLKRLDLDSTKVTDEGLKWLAPLQNLYQLDLNNTRVTDSGLPSLQSLASLEYLDVGKTAVTAEGVNRLRKALPKTSIVYGDRSSKEDSIKLIESILPR